ncbi:DNA methyltransferase [Clostridium sp.]|uniref:DNA methyltransferase n=1 Tax=Clostridium sp. TaxID=1506 RepID=UPI001DBD0EAC|nr:DNA methyltransferase [Clostridium sp.]MBS5307760.1 hypothetical protein [Clostridium sp.]
MSINNEHIHIGNGTLINGDNLEIMKGFKDNHFDNCISDFPYDLGFMGKKWDTYSNFYEWCNKRANELYRIIKHGGYVMIFGHHKTNHRMKCAFEDVGFKIVEEIDWVYASGFPKNQDISKMFDKDANVERIGTGIFNDSKGIRSGQNNLVGDDYNCKGYEITLPSSELAKEWSGWKTSGLKPAKEIITVFQKPLEGKYIDNIKKYGCGAMNIDACRIEYKNKMDLEIVRAKCNFTENSKSIGFGTAESLYGTGRTPLQQARDCVKEEGRFPANIIFDSYMGMELDEQSGLRPAGKSNNNAEIGEAGRLTPLRRGKLIPRNDVGGASRFFLNIDEELTPFMYCSKPTKKEKGEFCSHVTVKPKKLIKWLIKLVTPTNGRSLDITAGSGTHGLCCEELNNQENYNIEWVDIEMMNTEKEPYFNIAKQRIENTYNDLNNN